jgi:hypothetical protein
MEAMTTDVIHITDHLDVVERVVAHAHRRYGTWVDRDDLHQEAAIWWYQHGQKYLHDYLEDDNLVRLRRSIWRFIARYAEREKAHREGYEPIDQVRYRPAEILAMLPVALDPFGLPERGHPDGPAPKGNLAEGGDVLASLVDVRVALAALPEEDIQFLQLTEDLARDWDRVAAHTQTLPDSARRRHARIAERMARRLNDEEHV